MPIAGSRALQSTLTSVIASWMMSGLAMPPTVAQTTQPSVNSANATPSQVTLGDRLEELWRERSLGFILVGSVAAGALILYGSVLWIRPRWLLKMPSANIPLPYTKWQVPLDLVRWLKYQDRVLDDWVNRHWQHVETTFLTLDTVKDRNIHISLPVKLKTTGQFIDDLRGSHLQPILKSRPAVLLITGEGGAGKTSLACQVAQWGLHQEICSHRMLPVLIETELGPPKTLVEAIRGQLDALTNPSDTISPELLEKLLYRQRVLVIIDHFSEMSESTRKQVMPELADFPAKALVVTSRLEESLGKIPKTTLEPLRIEGSRLSRFMDAYLEQRQKRDLFEDEDYFEACRRLSRMVGQRNITVLLARLYANQMIEQQEGAGGTLPDSVPELMLSYLNQLNRTIPNHRDPDQVQQDAQRVAWECLRQTYRPNPAIKADVIAALASQGASQGADDAQDRLTYLEQRLRLLQTLEPGTKIRIVLDPLAEYLAALDLVAYCSLEPEDRWSKFIDSIDPILQRTNDPPDAIQGFLLAVRDCSLLKQKQAQVPDSIPEQLARKAGLDPEDLRRMEERRRIRLLISDLSAPELEYRIRAAEDLSHRGIAAAMAVPNLLGMVENLNQEIAARQAAAQALGTLGRCGDLLRDQIADRLIRLLLDKTDDPAIRRSAAESLGTMKAGKAELLSILNGSDQLLSVRQGVAYAISQMGAPSGEAIPMLMVELQSGSITTQVISISVWRESLTPQLTLDMVAIPGGEFLMGSPPEEVGRDRYASYFPETEGVDVEAQHRVTLQPFYMSQVPITQAQWRAIALSPQVNRFLNPDPASFKGDHRPVETVSWYDAMEFCARLSQLTGKDYRLPSEAEWEYACRAGTLSPFHVGDTLDGAIANYDARYTYGSGVTGEFRNATTKAGSLGVVNAWGLAEMHGQVWEWCLDHWHPSYDGAPTDGSPWLTDGDDRYRLLRGGSWCDDPGYCRSAIRYRGTAGLLNIDLGFRVVCGSPWAM